MPAGSAYHHHTLHARGAWVLQRYVQVRFQRHLAATAQAFIGSDDERRTAVGNAIDEGLRREAAEYDAVYRTNAGTGQHGHGRFGNHRQVEGNAIALLHAQLPQAGGEAVHLNVEFAVGDDAAVAGVVAFPDDGGGVAMRRQLPVQAVGGNVQLAIRKPADMEVFQCEAGVLHLRVRLHPVDLPAYLAPVAGRVFQAARIGGGVAGLGSSTGPGETGRNGVESAHAGRPR